LDRLESLSPTQLAELPDDDAAASAAAARSPSANPDAAENDPQLFNFERAWYPLAILETLKTDRPNAFQFLGKDVVIWRPSTAGPQQTAPPASQLVRGERRRFADGNWDDPSADGWVVQEDRCPHRLAPLSEGRLETDGTLQCAYHGWRFDGQGKTTLIPQLEPVDARAHARACAHPKSCVARFPARAFAGVLWVWGESGTSADVALRAATTPPNCIPRALMSSAEGGQEGGEERWRRLRPAGAGWYSRLVPVPMDMLLENFTDPSHVSHSHHGVIGDRDANHGTTMRLVSPAVAHGAGGRGSYCGDPPAPEDSRSTISRDGGYTFEVCQPPVSPGGVTPAPYLLHFRPPGHAWFEFPPDPSAADAERAKDDRVSMVLYATPAAPGWTRVFVSMLSPEGSTLTSPPMPNLPPFVRKIIAALDRMPALQHALNRNAILDGDDLFLAAQAQKLYGGPEPPADGHAAWRDEYYLPASVDVGVAALRRWIDVHGRKMPFLPQRQTGEAVAAEQAPPLPPLPSREVMFDRFNQHTKDCPHCSKALARCNVALWTLAAVGAACLGASLFAGLAAAFKLVAAEPARVWAVSAATAAGAAACALVARAVWGLRQLFVFHDYIHAEH
jgi:phenylpropionate dioxygenase-like ring-hydroxylating dioxygenase large terminal subunit